MRLRDTPPWLVAPVVALMVVLTGVGVYYALPPNASIPYDLNAVSFFTAYGLATGALLNTTHSIWDLVSVMGIASADPVNPPIVLGNQRSCAGLPSPTVWNTSALPLTTNPGQIH